MTLPLAALSLDPMGTKVTPARAQTLMALLAEWRACERRLSAIERFMARLPKASARRRALADASDRLSERQFALIQTAAAAPARTVRDIALKRALWRADLAASGAAFDGFHPLAPSIATDLQIQPASANRREALTTRASPPR